MGYPNTPIHTPSRDPDPSPEQAARLKKIGDALDWAYRQGYCFGEAAAVAFAEEHGLHLWRRDLGMYGDQLAFGVFAPD